MILTGEGGVELSVEDPEEKVVTAVPSLNALPSNNEAVELNNDLEVTVVVAVNVWILDAFSVNVVCAFGGCGVTKQGTPSFGSTL